MSQNFDFRTNVQGLQKLTKACRVDQELQKSDRGLQHIENFLGIWEIKLSLAKYKCHSSKNSLLYSSKILSIHKSV